MHSNWSVPKLISFYAFYFSFFLNRKTTQKLSRYSVRTLLNLAGKCQAHLKQRKQKKLLNDKLSHRQLPNNTPRGNKLLTFPYGAVIQPNETPSKTLQQRSDGMALISSRILNTEWIGFLELEHWSRGVKINSTLQTASQKKSSWVSARLLVGNICHHSWKWDFSENSSLRYYSCTGKAWC